MSLSAYESIIQKSMERKRGRIDDSFGGAYAKAKKKKGPFVTFHVHMFHRADDDDEPDGGMKWEGEPEQKGQAPVPTTFELGTAAKSFMWQSSFSFHASFPFTHRGRNASIMVVIEKLDESSTFTSESQWMKLGEFFISKFSILFPDGEHASVDMPIEEAREYGRKTVEEFKAGGERWNSGDN